MPRGRKGEKRAADVPGNGGEESGEMRVSLAPLKPEAALVIWN
jgi:hypothetical protein